MMFVDLLIAMLNLTLRKLVVINLNLKSCKQRITVVNLIMYFSILFNHLTVVGQIYIYIYTYIFPSYRHQWPPLSSPYHLHI